jgi:NitT/TauT family transport system substrate-binding protein
MASHVFDAFTTKTRVDPGSVCTDAGMPACSELDILPPARK